MFIAALYILTQRWKQARYLPPDEYVNKMRAVHIMEYYLAIKSTDAWCYSMGKSWEQYAQGKKSILKDHILHDSISAKVQD